MKSVTGFSTGSLYRSGIPFEERVKLLALLREKVSNGVKSFPRSPEIKQLHLDIEKEYLMVGSGAKR